MKTLQSFVLATLCGATLWTCTAAASPQAKSYQVTGPVIDVTDTTITVQKGDQVWQIARDAGTKIGGDVKVGAKVTIEYRMVATDVEVKTAKTEKAEKPEKAVKPKTADKKTEK